MDTITSSEFRRIYASLTAETEVTSNGHVLGTWNPMARTIARAQEIEREWRARGWDGSEADAKRFYGEFVASQISDLQVEISERETELRGLGIQPDPAFNSRPFRPVPKSGR